MPPPSVFDAAPLTNKLRLMLARLRQRIALKKPSETDAFTVETLDLTAPHVAQNPFPYYEELRKLGSVHFLPQHGYWLLIGFSEVLAALMNPQIFSSRVSEWLVVDEVLLGADPPEHTVVRRLLAPHFSAPELESHSAFAEQAASKLLKPLSNGESIDVLRELGFPLSEDVAAHLLGFDNELLSEVRAVQNESVNSLSDQLNRLDSIIAAASHRIPLYVTLLRDSQGTLNQRDIRSLIRFLWIAGTTTTRRVIASSVMLLLQHPEIRSIIQSDGALLSPFVEESIRIYPPEHLLARISTAETELSGVKIPAGARVRLCVAAANRDPAYFKEPLSIRLDRSPNRQLSFGNGVHRCLGAPLARIEVTAALKVLLRLAPHFRSVEPLESLPFVSFINDSEQLVIES